MADEEEFPDFPDEGPAEFSEDEDADGDAEEQQRGSKPGEREPEERPEPGRSQPADFNPSQDVDSSRHRAEIWAAYDELKCPSTQRTYQAHLKAIQQPYVQVWPAELPMALWPESPATDALKHCE